MPKKSPRKSTKSHSIASSDEAMAMLNKALSYLIGSGWSDEPPKDAGDGRECQAILSDGTQKKVVKYGEHGNSWYMPDTHVRATVILWESY